MKATGETTMNDLSIIHLSDLHIDSNNTSYSRLLKKLISDIETEAKNLKDSSAIVVVTGDIIHQGIQYSKNQNAYNNALSFFKDLYSVIKDKVVGIYIVPGNHDKHRTGDSSFLISAYRSMDGKCSNAKDQSIFNKDFYSWFWNNHLATYDMQNGSGYIELTKQIYKVFGMTEEEILSKKYITDTFGVDVIEVYQRKYCFVLLNTSWSCCDDTDSRKMILGDFQIEILKNQFKELIGQYKEQDRPSVTFILGHHPVSALSGVEEDKIFNEMISFDGFDANVYLCGHTHDRTVNNWINNRHSLNTFVTGIGWPETSQGVHVGNHTYSMYTFNLDANSIDVYVRSTNDGGAFYPDFRIYTTETNLSQKKLVFPIRSEKAQTYIPLSVGNDKSPKAYYISDEFINSIHEYVKKIGYLQFLIRSMIEDDKNDVFMNLFSEDEAFEEEMPEEEDKIELQEEEDEIELQEELLYNYLFANIDDDSPEMLLKINEIFSQNPDILYETFLGFLQKLCQKMHEILVSDMCEEKDIVRFHFRFLSDKKTFQYSKLCASFCDESTQLQHEVSEIKYGQLIEKSYSCGKSLIYSVNEEFTETKLSEKWRNFITVVPIFEKNNYTKKSGAKNKKVPYITFGATINDDKFNNLLYCLDYFSIKEMLEELIEHYLDLFQINIDAFCSWAKKYLERGN